jgi:hypothetical protein
LLCHDNQFRRGLQPFGAFLRKTEIGAWTSSARPADARSLIRYAIFRTFEKGAPRLESGIALDGIWLKRCWGGEVRNVPILVADGVDQDGFRQVLGVMAGAKEDTESWTAFLRYLKARGLRGVRLFISDKCLGLVESLAEFYPEAAWQRCVVRCARHRKERYGRRPT